MLMGKGDIRFIFVLCSEYLLNEEIDLLDVHVTGNTASWGTSQSRTMHAPGIALSYGLCAHTQHTAVFPGTGHRAYGRRGGMGSHTYHNSELVLN